MTPEQVAKLTELLLDLDAVQTKTDHEGGREVAWYYQRDAIEDAMGLARGALNTYPEHERAEAIRDHAEANLSGPEYDAAWAEADRIDPWESE